MNTGYKLLTVAGVTGGCGGVYFVARPYFSPEEKITTADFNKKGVWKSIFLTHKDDADFKSVFTLTGSEAVDTAAISIRNKCQQLVDSNSKDLVKKWCVIPTPKTVEAKLYLEEYELASDDDDRQNLFVLNKENENFINAIKGSDGNFTKSSQKSDAKGKVDVYCTAKMKSEASDSSYENIKNWCTKPPRDLRAKLVADGMSPIEEGDVAGWEDKYETLKGESGFLTAIDLSSSGSAPDKKQGGPKLKDWCVGKYSKKLHEDNVYPDDFNASKTRCVN